jgi:hypothetical protein
MLRGDYFSELFQKILALAWNYEVAFGGFFKGDGVSDFFSYFRWDADSAF